MSVAPDQMPGLTGMNQPADPNLQQFQQLEGQAADVETAAATNTAQTAQAMQGMQPPQRQTGIFTQAPYLMALAALGGKAIGLHARVMLGGMNGMVKGMLMGNQQAYDDAIKTYTENRQKMLDTWDLQQKYYAEMVQAYGDRADAKLKAWTAAEKMASNQFNQNIAVQGLALDRDKFAFDRMQKTREYAERVRLDDSLINKRAGSTADQLTPRAAAILSEATAQGIPLPTGSRSAKVLNTVFNSLAERYPSDSPEAIVQRMRSGEIDMKTAMTEAQVAGRREAGVSTAIMALNQSGGLYEQLDKAAKDVDFGSAKFKNQAELAIQGKAVADPKIQYYVTKLQETRAELSQVFARAGVPTDMARRQADEALPMGASYQEMQAAIRSSQEAAQSVESGNQKFIDALKSGKPMSESLNIGGSTPSAGRTVVRSGQSASTGQTYVQYSDGTVEALGGNPGG